DQLISPTQFPGGRQHRELINRLYNWVCSRGVAVITSVARQPSVTATLRRQAPMTSVVDQVSGDREKSKKSGSGDTRYLRRRGRRSRHRDSHLLHTRSVD